MKNSTIKGKINNAKTASALDINLDNSSFIELTGNSYYTSLNNDDKTGRIFTKITMNLENMTKLSHLLKVVRKILILLC